MRKGRRRRRVSLRGWWRALPFVAMAGATFFVFTWLHAQRLHSEYRAIELTAEIDRVKERIVELSGERHRLGRMDRISEEAQQPKYALEPREPGQVQVITPAPGDLRTLAAATPPARPTRSVILILNTQDALPPAETPGTALAQTNPQGTAAAEGNL